MAIGDLYATLPEFKDFLKVGDTVDDLQLSAALATTSRGLEHYCRRQFNRAETATTRTFTVRQRAYTASTADFYVTTDLAVATDPAGDETFTGVLDPATLKAEPRDGIVDGEEGWPYTRVVTKPTALCGLVQVTARWGWAAIPAPVTQACLILSSELFKLKDAPFGVAAFGEYGPIRVRQNPMACNLLQPYRRSPLLVG